MRNTFKALLLSGLLLLGCGTNTVYEGSICKDSSNIGQEKHVDINSEGEWEYIDVDTWKDDSCTDRVILIPVTVSTFDLPKQGVTHITDTKGKSRYFYYDNIELTFFNSTKTGDKVQTEGTQCNSIFGIGGGYGYAFTDLTELDCSKANTEVQ